MRIEEKGTAWIALHCSSWTVLHAQCTSALSSGFLISQGNAETLERWGGKTKHHLISHFLSNTSAKNYRNRIVYVKIIASGRWDVFWDTVQVAWSVCRSVTVVSPAKAAEPIEMPFGLWARMGRMNHVLDGGGPEMLRDVAMATNFGTKIAINWLCVNDSD